MIFLHGLALVVYEFQRYLKYRDDQREEMLKRAADQQAAEAYAAQEKLMVDNAMEADRLAVAAAVEKAEDAAAAEDAGYAAWKEAMIFAALEAERVSAYSTKNAGSPATLEVKILEAEALEKAHIHAGLEKERAAAAAAIENAKSAAERRAEKLSGAVADLASGEDTAAATAPKANTVPAKPDKPKKKGIFGGMKTGFML